MELTSQRGQCEGVGVVPWLLGSHAWMRTESPGECNCEAGSTLRFSDFVGLTSWRGHGVGMGVFKSSEKILMDSRV